MAGRMPGRVEGVVLRPDARARTAETWRMFEFHHHADPEPPTVPELLAEAGLDPRAIREILAGPDGRGE